MAKQGPSPSGKSGSAFKDQGSIETHKWLSSPSGRTGSVPPPLLLSSPSLQLLLKFGSKMSPKGFALKQRFGGGAFWKPLAHKGPALIKALLFTDFQLLLHKVWPYLKN